MLQAEKYKVCEVWWVTIRVLNTRRKQQRQTDLLLSFAKSVSVLQSQQGRDWPTHNENGEYRYGLEKLCGRRRLPQAAVSWAGVHTTITANNNYKIGEDIEGNVVKFKVELQNADKIASYY